MSRKIIAGTIITPAGPAIPATNNMKPQRESMIITEIDRLEADLKLCAITTEVSLNRFDPGSRELPKAHLLQHVQVIKHIVKGNSSKLKELDDYMKEALREVIEAKAYALKTGNNVQYNKLNTKHITLGEVNQILRGEIK